jgi:hypothetical protein
MTVIKPETLVRWHRAGFRRYRRWKSRNRGRPPISAELRALIRRMSLENTLWGAPHIHGELLKLGFTVAQSTVAKYMAKKRDDPSGQSWSTFLRNHMPHIAAIDLFVVPTIGFRLLYALVIVRLARRELAWTNVTARPTAHLQLRQSLHPIPERHRRTLGLGDFAVSHGKTAHRARRVQITRCRGRAADRIFLPSRGSRRIPQSPRLLRVRRQESARRMDRIRHVLRRGRGTQAR